MSPSAPRLLLRRITDTAAEAGVDEAGRGCLAGPVVAAAVILPPDFDISGLDDSKKLSEKRRAALRIRIEENADWCVAIASPQEIDRINILRASMLAMRRAIQGLRRHPRHLAIDGNRFEPCGIPFTTVVGGDARYAHIAAASILAKTHRDELMLRLAAEYPCYGWDRNKGYPTAEHKEAILTYGATPHHRVTFRGVQPAIPGLLT